MDYSEAFQSLDECVRIAWSCKSLLNSIVKAYAPQNFERYSGDICSLINEICVKWKKVTQISSDFLDFVAKDNSARFPPKDLPFYEGFYYRSWHQFAIETLNMTVQWVFMLVDNNRDVFSDYEHIPAFDISKLKLNSKNFMHVHPNDIETIFEEVPDYTLCITALRCERDNCLSSYYRNRDTAPQISGGRESVKLTPEVAEIILSVGKNILDHDRGIQKQSLWKEIKRRLDQTITDAPAVETIRRHFDYDKTTASLKFRAISGKH